MLQTAVFVDAGYLYAQGSALLAGKKAPRHTLRLNVPLLISDLREEALGVERNARLLRIYWYDGVARGGALNFDQRAVAETQDVKCRFGTISGSGEQKGVDSLIVTDMIELARGQAISDALILSGDEDIRVGVQVAQSFGIRVHLLGIQPARGSQSPDLRTEADTLLEWEESKVQRWLAVVAPEQPNIAAPAKSGAEGDELADWISQVVEQRTNSLDPVEAVSILSYIEANRNQLPPDFDRPSLAVAGNFLKRELEPDERISLRNALREAVRAIVHSSN